MECRRAQCHFGLQPSFGGKVSICFNFRQASEHSENERFNGFEDFGGSHICTRDMLLFVEHADELLQQQGFLEKIIAFEVLARHLAQLQVFVTFKQLGNFRLSLLSVVGRNEKDDV